MSSIKCKNCGHEIPETHIEPRKPCPNCGSTKRIVNASIEPMNINVKMGSVKVSVIRKVLKKYPIISFLYFSITVLSLIIGYIIPGILGLVLAIPLVYFADYFSKERKEERNRREQQ